MLGNKTESVLEIVWPVVSVNTAGWTIEEAIKMHIWCIKVGASYICLSYLSTGGLATAVGDVQV